MRFLEMISEPKEISEYKNSCKRVGIQSSYNDMPKKELRKMLLANQGGLCAYCMSRIHNNDIKTRDNGYLHIEHIIPEREPVVYEGYNSNIDVKNLIGVCAGNRMDSDNENKHCDSSRGGTEIFITPYDKTIMSSIKYRSDGSIYSTDPRINDELNDLLHLNSNRNSLKQNRMTAYRKLRDMVQSKCKGKTIKKVQLEKIRNLFCSKDADGLYIEYVGVFEYWLNKWERKSG